MPLLSIEISLALEAPAIDALLGEASGLVAGLLGKPESYMMVRHQYNPAMRLGGHDAPLALIELRSIGLPETAPAELSKALCALLERHAGIPGTRVYLLFADVPRARWGHNGTTL
ncbi:phenylpyruvate tautomerase MIF-related protein [Acidihalobacter prosperus]|uniref:L-dopachrome isomerase n=1 Tax=Acidihalobacter prosperus TaxID=160660 RepID=A0A1A6C5U1_9GAMM|nr:phenylpyruvate tautomerase MIF-related protein [Acidihalobacter prosperus]OBS09933.1 hypothetical protein Thpro_020983 [Acidihalobacter prosperus]